MFYLFSQKIKFAQKIKENKIKTSNLMVGKFLYNIKKTFDEAVKYYKSASKGYEEIENLFGQSVVLCKLGVILLNQEALKRLKSIFYKGYITDLKLNKIRGIPRSICLESMNR